MLGAIAQGETNQRTASGEDPAVLPVVLGLWVQKFPELNTELVQVKGIGLGMQEC